MKAISPDYNAYDFTYLYQRKGQINSRKINLPLLPSIKQTKDQTTTTEEMKTTENFFDLDIKDKRKFIFNGINNSIQKIQYNDFSNDFNIIRRNFLNKNIKISSINMDKNNKNTKLFFNRNYKLKSIEKTMIKSKSNINIKNKKKIINYNKYTKS